MDIFAISGITNGLVALSFGVLIAFKNWREMANRVFFLMTLSLAVWSFGYWQWLLAGNADLALFWVRVFSAGSLFIPVFYFHWVLLFLQEEKNHKPLIGAVYIFALSLLLFSFFNSSLFIQGVEKKLFFDFWPRPGVLYGFYVNVIYFGLVAYSFYLLIKHYRRSRLGEQRGRILYILLGAFIGFGGGATNFFLWYDIPIPPFGNFLVAFFPPLLAYSVIKHRLFNARTIATELLVFFIIVVLFIQVLLSASIIEVVLRGTFFLIVSLLGYLLIRSVYNEVRIRERMEKLAKDLKKANVRLRELDQRKSEFVSLASHQLRSPLTAIKGYASMLLEGSFGSMPEGARTAVGRIFNSSNRLVTLVEDFLTISRIEQNRLKYEFQSIDLKEVVQTVMNEFKPQLAKKELEVLLKVQGLGDYRITADRGKINQVVENLIDNAIKYTPKGRISFLLSKDSHKHTILLTITDTGVGMSQKTIDKLFEKFFRAPDASKISVTGTGLGLYVVSQIVKAHHGRVWAESRGEGTGSTFYMELPME